jgi:hypothetical protein
VNRTAVLMKMQRRSQHNVLHMQKRISALSMLSVPDPIKEVDEEATKNDRNRAQKGIGLDLSLPGRLGANNMGDGGVGRSRKFGHLAE